MKKSNEENKKMTKRKKQPITHHIEVQAPPRRIKPIEVHNRNTPLYLYKRSVKSLNRDIRALKHDIRQARLLKIQAYIAYRLTK